MKLAWLFDSVDFYWYMDYLVETLEKMFVAQKIIYDMVR